MWHFWLHPLRGFAALGIVLLHSYWTWSFYDVASVRKLYLMVDLFFVLSGFVISAGYAQRLSKPAEVGHFVRQRIRRLSFHYISSGMVWTVAMLAIVRPMDLPQLLLEVIRYICFSDIFVEDATLRVNPVAWSVMAEVWVYGAFALLTFLIRSCRVRAALSLGLSAVGLLILGHGEADLNLIYGSAAILRACTGFFLGSFCWLTLKLIGSKQACCAGVAVMMALASVQIHFEGSSTDLLAAPLSAMLVIVFADVRPPRNVRLTHALRWVGDLSYPLYLWHFLFSVIIAKALAAYYGKGKIVTATGEQFVRAPEPAALAACLMLVVISVVWSMAMMRTERHLLGWWDRRRGLALVTS